MTPAVLHWLESLHLEGRTLDVGALDVNGTPRLLFPDYTGLDMRPGPNVDILANAHNIPFPDASFDNVLCLETLEHDSAFWLTIPELSRLLKPAGHLVLTASGIAFGKHYWPSDYWRFTAEGLTLLLIDLAGLQLLSAHESANQDAAFAHGRRFPP